MGLRAVVALLAACLCLLSQVAQADACFTGHLPNSPDSDYMDHGDGTATHRPTGLMWKRCSEGQTWNGSTCLGERSTYTWKAALGLGGASGFADYSDWRVPNVKELRSVVESCRTDPAINRTIFPNAVPPLDLFDLSDGIPRPPAFYWSSTHKRVIGGSAWSVDFNEGWSTEGNNVNALQNVRLVRAGLSLGAFDTYPPDVGSGGGDLQPQSISFGGAPSLAFGGTGAVSATGGASGKPVMFTTITPQVCTVTGSTVSALAVGDCTIAANQAGNASYNAAAQVTQTINVTAIAPGPPTAVSAVAGNASATVSFTAPASNGGRTITGYTVISSPAGGVDSDAGSTALPHAITGLTNGTAYTFTVTATNSVGSSASSSASNSITPGEVQSISFGTAPTIVVGGTGTVTATGGASGNPVTFTSTTPSICTVSGINGSTVTGVAVGTCTIAANQARNSSYAAAAQVTQNITVNAGAPGSPTAAVVVAGNASATVSFTAPASNGGSVITGYTVTSSPAGGVDSNAGSTALTHAITGLTNGVAYTFTVNATNSLGSSPASAASGSVTPREPLPVGIGASRLATGTAHSCGVTSTGGLRCWGDNRSGQLGDGTSISGSIAADVTGLSSGVVSVVVGSAHTCALSTDGVVKCWGLNKYGQLGDGSSTSRSTPTDVTGLSSGIVAIAAGFQSTCALTTMGAVKCWGLNDYLRWGSSGSMVVSAPMNVNFFGSGVVAIAAGAVHTCAVTAVGGVSCVGDNRNGQLGNGVATPGIGLTADVLDLSSGVVSITAGGNHTCALTTAGGVKCWGYNGNGQLGDGSTANRTTPVDVSGLASEVAAISAGADHTCALSAVGAVNCWGYNGAGQIGDGTTTGRLIPTTVSGLGSGVASISAGSTNTCALTTTGVVKCWGNNDYGQLGDGSFTGQLNPIADVLNFTTTGTASQSITLGAAPTLVVGGTGVLTATGGASGNPVFFSSATPSICTTSGINGSTMTGVAAGTCTITANQAGNASYAAAGQVTQNITVSANAVSVPGNPTGVTVVVGNASATVSFTAPASNGGSAITGYTVTSSPAGGVDGNAGTTALTHVVTGLANGTAYTFAVTATNATGTSVPSAVSNSVTPMAGTFALGVTLAGTGSGTVSSAPTGINCGATCSASFGIASSVTITAASASGSTFAGWSGACTGTSTTCTVTMNAANSVTATFSAASTTGINAGLTAYYKFDGDVLDSGANASHAALVGGSSYVSGVTGNALNIDNLLRYASASNIVVGSAFTYSGWYRLASNTTEQWHSLFHSNSYCGSGVSLGVMYERVNKFLRIYDGLNCSGIRSINHTVPYDTWFHFAMTYDGASIKTYIDGVLKDSFVRTGAIANVSPFVIGANLHPLAMNWQGAIDEVRIYSRALSGTEIIAVKDDPLATFSLTASLAGSGAGSVTGSGINCGTSCSASFANGSSVTLTATPAAGSSFDGWTGACTGTSTSCVVSMNAAANATATFTLIVTVPGAPTNITAGAGNGQAIVSFTVPASNGGSAITSYTARSTPGNLSASGAASPLTVTGLTNGTAYTFAVTASNSAGTSASSASSSSVTPIGSQTITFGSAPTLYVGGVAAVSAVGGTSGNPVTFSSTTASVCGVSGTNGSVVTGIAEGTCVIAANQGGSGGYAAAGQATQSFTVGTAPVTPLSLGLGWNLLGNSLNQALSVVPTFADSAVVSTVWKWDVVKAGWQFYTPLLTSTELQAYASSKGFSVLSVINPGEGFWVNAKVAASLGAQSGTAFALTSANLATGWNLVATGNDVTPSVFNISLSATLPAPGTIPVNMTTLWAWDNALSGWYFYAPSLEADGGLATYIASKGYLDFTQHSKTLGKGTGFWVSKP